MKRRMIKIISINGLLFSSLFVASLAQATLCNIDEEIIAQCSLKNGKFASICSQKREDDEGFGRPIELQYRFGTKDNIEFYYPDIQGKADNIFKYSQFITPYEPRSFYEVTFRNGKYMYIFHEQVQNEKVGEQFISSYHSGLSVQTVSMNIDEKQLETTKILRRIKCTESPHKPIIRSGGTSLTRDTFNTLIEY